MNNTNHVYHLAHHPMYNETQLAAIKLFGRKDLTEGCIVNEKGQMYKIYGEFYNGCRYLMLKCIFREKGNIDLTFNEKVSLVKKNFEILGHIPHLEDLFRVAEENAWEWVANSSGWISFSDGWCNIGNGIEYIHTIPLLSQPNLDKIVNLFTKVIV